MTQNLITFEKALKENYLPVWRNQLGVEPSALLAKIKKKPLTSNKIVAAAPIGLSGGFGYGSELLATPKAGGVKMERFETNAKDMYVNIQISEKAVRLTGSGGAMANALDTEVKGAYETAKWNVGRSLFGNGTGVLTKTTELSDTNNKVIIVESTMYVKEGLIIDIYSGDPGADDASVVKSGARIVSVDRASSAIMVDDGIEGFAAGFITVQNSYNNEITGLGAIFDGNIKNLYGLEKASNAFLLPTELDCQDDIDDSLITRALRRAKNDKNSNIDTLLCGDDAYDSYVAYLRTNNTRLEDVSKTVTGGYKALKFVFGNKEVDIINESFVPSTEMWGVDSTALELHTQEWNFAELQGGGIFNLMEGQSAYRALLANYGDLICTNPGGCLRLYNCGFDTNSNS